MSEDKKKEYIQTTYTHDEAKQLILEQGYSEKVAKYWLAHWRIK